jgi:hypothetical protein
MGIITTVPAPVGLAGMSLVTPPPGFEEALTAGTVVLELEGRRVKIGPVGRVLAVVGLWSPTVWLGTGKPRDLQLLT